MFHLPNGQLDSTEDGLRIFNLFEFKRAIVFRISAWGGTMGGHNNSIILKKVSPDKGEEESAVQLEFSIVMTALIIILITGGYFIYNGFVG